MGTSLFQVLSCGLNGALGSVVKKGVEVQGEKTQKTKKSTSWQIKERKIKRKEEMTKKDERMMGGVPKNIVSNL